MVLLHKNEIKQIIIWCREFYEKVSISSCVHFTRYLVLESLHQSWLLP